VRSARIADRVTFFGYRDDVHELLARSDIAVLTSIKEGIPRAVLEAMAAGVPVVATRPGNLRGGLARRDRAAGSAR
jgi:glycosyltransferase involved in cell wall biosynthesis